MAKRQNTPEPMARSTPLPPASVLRQKAIDCTPYELSRQLLDKFDTLVWDEGPFTHEGDYYRESFDVQGAVCAPAREAMMLYHAVKLMHPQHALEIGTYTGWTAAHIASGLQGSTLLDCIDSFIECEYPDIVEDAWRKHLADYPWAVLRKGESPAIFSGIAPASGWDFVFLDGEHNDGQPLKDVQSVVGYLADNAVIVLHDTWMIHVEEAGRWLEAQGYTPLAFNTTSQLTFFWKKKPTWWKKFLTAVSEL